MECSLKRPQGFAEPAPCIFLQFNCNTEQATKITKVGQTYALTGAERNDEKLKSTANAIN